MQAWCEHGIYFIEGCLKYKALLMALATSSLKVIRIFIFTFKFCLSYIVFS